MALFPNRYPDLKTIRFSAGIEVGFLHLGLWGLSWMVRFGIFPRLNRLAREMLAVSRWFNWLGSAKSGFHMTMTGTGLDGKNKVIDFEISARSGDGPYIPCIPAILLVQRLAASELLPTGAFPCIGIINRDDYLAALSGLDIDWTLSER